MAKFPNKKNNLPPSKRNNFMIFFIIATIIIIIGYFINQGMSGGSVKISYTEFKTLIEKNVISSLTIKGLNVTGDVKKPYKLNEGSSQAKEITSNFHTQMPVIADQDPDIEKLLTNKDININSEPVDDGSSIWLIFNVVFFVLIIGFFFWSSRRIGQQSGGIFDVGKSKSKKITKEISSITFDDVAGLENVKRDVQEIIDFLKDPNKFLALGAEIPKGVLLVGPPGTGKTLVAKAVAGEADVPFYAATGSEFVEMFVGVGASRVRDLFQKAKQDAPCIIFIDEIDAVGRSRGTGLGGGHDEREQTLNQLLTEMDGMSTDRSVIVMAATNRPDVLDQALLRPGRFDRQVTLDKPRVKERHAILKIHSRNKPLADDVDLEILAKATPGFSGADLENLLNESALLTGRLGKKKITMEILNEAKDKVLMGDKRPDMLTKKEKHTTAYHEAGHALVARLMPSTDPVYKITIIPRGMSLGSTWYLPDQEKFGYTKTEMLSMVSSLLAGYISEKIFIGDVSTGAANDIKRATELVRNMVTKYGMSESIGLVNYALGEEHVFLGKELGAEKKFSDLTLAEIDKEVRMILNECVDKTEKLLQKNQETMHKIAQFLYLNEEMSNEEMEDIVKKYSKTSLDELEKIKKYYKNKSNIKIKEVKSNGNGKTAEKEQDSSENEINQTNTENQQ